MSFEEYRFHIPDDLIRSVLEQVRSTPFPPCLGDGGWDHGVSHAFMRRFVDYWTEEFDWRNTEAELNRWPKFRVAIGDIKVHFYHVRGEGESPRPLLLTHGWPGSVLEYLPLVDTLTHPSRHGGSAADAFSVVIPSVPGFAASELPDGHEMGPVLTAELWRTLMVDVLKYDRFAIHAGDFGAVASMQLADRFPQHIVAMHLTAFPVSLDAPDRGSPEEMAYPEDVARSSASEMGYLQMHAYKTNTVAFALSANPMGTAAWILEKFQRWSDNDGDVLAAFTLERLCANVALYVYTGTIGTSIRLYEGFNRELGWQFRPPHKIQARRDWPSSPKSCPLRSRRGAGRNDSSTSGGGRRCPVAATSQPWRNRISYGRTSKRSSEAISEGAAGRCRSVGAPAVGRTCAPSR